MTRRRAKLTFTTVTVEDFGKVTAADRPALGGGDGDGVVDAPDDMVPRRTQLVTQLVHNSVQV